MVFIVILELLMALQLALAVTPGRLRRDDLTCEAEDSDQCTCEGKPIGPGIKGEGVAGMEEEPRTEDTVESDLLAAKTNSFWDFKAFQNGKEVPMNTFKSKLALVVNVASA